MRAGSALVFAIVLGTASAAVGQPTGAPAPSQPDAQQRRDKIKQRIRAIRAYTLTEQLELDEEAAAKLFPALVKYDEVFDRLHAARAVLQRRLAEAGSLSDAKAIDAVIDETTANQQAIWQTEAQRLVQLRKILTPAQVARVLIVLPAIERKIHSRLRTATQKTTQKTGAPRPAPPAGDDLKSPFDKPARNRKPKGANVNPFDKPCDPFSSSHGCRK
jgi:Spy/CpxP family protein refolding chaperone